MAEMQLRVKALGSIPAHTHEQHVPQEDCDFPWRRPRTGQGQIPSCSHTAEELWFGTQGVQRLHLTDMAVSEYAKVPQPRKIDCGWRLFRIRKCGLPASVPESRAGQRGGDHGPPVLTLLPFQRRRELAGATAPGVLPHPGQPQPRGLHAVLQVRPRQGCGARLPGVGPLRSCRSRPH